MAGGIDTFTKLLLHCDGADSSTMFTDASSSGHSVAANANAQVDTGQSQFGGASLLLDGTADNLSIAGHSDWAFGTGDFTVDFWLRPNGSLTSHTVMGNRNASGVETHWNIEIEGGAMNLQVHSSASPVFSETNNLLTASTWQHVAWSRSGTTGRLFIGGLVQETVTDSRNYSDAATSLIIGQDGAAPGSGLANFNGWIDEIRISKGIARWTGNFTPPAGPYSRISPAAMHSYRQRRAA